MFAAALIPAAFTTDTANAALTQTLAGAWIGELAARTVRLATLSG
ncbi:hypothetical protein [Streptomyces sp. NBC_01304]|nr:hypothetical protein OG430_10745 [Streptomyces sp. NBC_01304]